MKNKYNTSDTDYNTLGTNYNTSTPVYNNSSTTSISISPWGTSVIIKVEEIGESIEITYKQKLMQPEYRVGIENVEYVRVYKIIYSCKNGKWNKSEPIFGHIIPASEEYYIFE